MNIFKRLIDSRKIKTKDDLKRHFRVLAKKIHPDSSQMIEGNARFIKLKSDYEEATSWLPAEQGKGGRIARKAVTRKDIMNAFWDLEASSFPVDMSVRNSSKLYQKRVMDFSGMISSADVIGECSFLDVEDELYKIRGNDIVDNPLFGKIRMIFYNIVAWHLEPKKFTKVALEKWLSEISGELLEKEFFAAHAFIKWLIEDMENGSAL